MLTVVSMRASITLTAWQSSEIGRYEIPREESLPSLGIGMTIDDFQINRIRHDVTESLKSAVIYSIAFGPRLFGWKILSLSGSNALVLLQLLIPVITWAVVNVTADINDFRFISLDTSRVSREEVCLPSFDW